MNHLLCPVILAGGVGTRLWPLSRMRYPKQFLDLLGNGDTLLQATAKRLSGLATDRPLTVVANEEHRFLVAEQLHAIKREGQILLEPAARNTAPAIALAAMRILAQLQSGGDDDAILLVLPADHFIADTMEFQRSVRIAMSIAETGKLVTLGVQPTVAETGYGYIEKGRPLDGAEGFMVERFVEKPDAATAQRYLDSRAFLWNSGIFVFRASSYLRALEHFAPAMYQACRAAMDTVSEDMTFVRVGRAAFEQSPSDSVDYAVMEKTTNAAVVPLEAGWSDVGSWTALWDVSTKDAMGNVVVGDTLIRSSAGNYVHAASRLVTLVGVNDLAVIETADAVLVVAKDRVQEVKQAVDQLKAMERVEQVNHRQVLRPWGWYDSIDHGERYQVKHIVVAPGAKLSVQMHFHRAEHWVVVSGTARVTKGEQTFLLTENQSTYIPSGEVHTLENPGKIPLEIIEVQSGSYLGEDDIVRFEDRYGRR